MAGLLNPGFVIAEIAQSHEGSLGMAYSMIDASADAGADAVKFQTHIANAESTLDEPWRVKFSKQDKTRFDYWKRMEFTEEEWAGLAEYAKKKNLIFLSSPFSVEALTLLDRIGVPLWKIPSGELNNTELLEAVWMTKKPLLISSGMSSFSELDAVISETKRRGISFGVFQCTSEYPSRPESWGLNMIDFFRKRYDCPIGLSDHSGSIYAGLAAAAFGADFTEVHVAFSKKMFGPDVQASLTFEELALLVKGIREIKRAISSPIDKDLMAEEKATLRNIFGRSWALRKDLPAGTLLTREHVSLKKPGGGIPREMLDKILGNELRSDKSALNLLSFDDIKPPKK